MTRISVLVCIVILSVVVGCSQAPQPDIEATVQAALAATQTAQALNMPTAPATNIPTATSAPTASATPVPPTATPIPTPVDTPTPQGPALHLISATDYTDDVGWDHIIGVVENISNQPLGFIKIVVTVKDDADNVVGTGFTYTDLDVLLPGERSPFDVASDNWGDWSTYSLQSQADASDEVPRRDVVVKSDRSYVDEVGWFHVVGEVENAGNAAAEFVKAVVTLYDSSGEIAGMMFTYTDLDAISAGGTSPFDAATQYHFDVDHYEVAVQAE
jgi:hypothetical protein